MSHVHVCLVSDQAITNLTTSLQLRPDIVVLLTIEEMLPKIGTISLTTCLKVKFSI
jgi:hypothetical protein